MTNIPSSSPLAGIWPRTWFDLNGPRSRPSTAAPSPRSPSTISSAKTEPPPKSASSSNPTSPSFISVIPSTITSCRLKKDGLRGDASNAVEENETEKPQRKRRTPIPRAKETFIVVHRLDNSLYYKRIDAREYRLLTSLQRGQPLGKAIQSAFTDAPDSATIREWFQTWTELGWFCTPK